MLKFMRKLMPTKTLAQSKVDFTQLFFQNPQHQWINENPRFKKIFTEFIASIPLPVKDFFAQHPLIILKANKKFSCSLDIPAGHKVILVFPDLLERLRSVYYEEAMAIIAHELGHLYQQHSHQSIDPLEAQVAADAFAAELGYYNQLINIIEEEAQGIEAKVRLVYLNSKYMFAKKAPDKDEILN